MAESSDGQNLFTCPICLHLLKNPVTTYCGHSFCMDCLDEFWDRDNQKGVYSCPQCRQTFTPRPTLSRNTVMAAVVEKMEREDPEAGTVSPVMSLAVSGDVECDICTETKLKAIKSCLVCLASYCESHIQTHYTSPALKRHKLVNASPHLLEQICSEHDKLLELYCCKDQQLICVQCALINHQNHKMTSAAAERPNTQQRLKEKLDCLHKEIHQREQKVQEIRQAIVSHENSSEAAVKLSEEVFTQHITDMMNRRVQITAMIRFQQKAKVSGVEELIVTLEQEISDLKRRCDELGQLSQLEDDIYVIQNFFSLSSHNCSDLSDISISQHLTFKEIEKVICELRNQLEDLCKPKFVRISERISAVHIMANKENTTYLPSQPETREEFLKYSTNLKLSGSTACYELSVYGKSVSRDDGERNNTYRKLQPPTYQVLCKESLSKRCYFEVVWKGSGISIGFTYDQNYPKIPFGSNKRSWKCDFPTANLTVQHNAQNTNLPMVSKIGVFLNQAAGTLSFYNVTEKMTFLHQIQATFSQPIYPGFSFQGWKNGSSVTICDL